MPVQEGKQLIVPKPTYSRIAEHAFIAGTRVQGILQQREFETAEASAEWKEVYCPLYMIAKRRKVVLVPESFGAHPGFIEFELELLNGTQGRRKFKLPSQYKPEKIEFDCPYPHNFFRILVDGALMTEGFFPALLSYAKAPELSDWLALEVLYVGQAQGKDGSRDALDRLSKHETFQLILGDALSANPDFDVWAMPLSLFPTDLAMLNGWVTSSETSAEVAEEFLRKPLDEMPANEWVNIAEAALIRYFQPEYNIRFRKHFPDRGHTSYRSLYDSDFNSIVVEVQSGFDVKIFSSTTAPQIDHFASWSLVTDEDRYAMLELDKMLKEGAGDDS